MSKYLVTKGQNLYDVALHIYGSIEGIIDLLINNDTLSLTDTLKPGDELIYSDDFLVNASMVAYFKRNKITPANGEQEVYYKQPNLPLVIELIVPASTSSAAFTISGSGELEIDWGDNTPIQHLPVTKELLKVEHYFNNQIAKKRKIKIHGEITVSLFDLTPLIPESIYFMLPVAIEKLFLKNINDTIEFIHLIKDSSEITLSNLSTFSILPLLSQKKLRKLELSGAKLTTQTVDEYLISMVHHYYERRSCTVTLSQGPSGEYQEPQKDENNLYILTSGMEAIWVIVNEPAWNEGGYWKFIIHDKIYTSQP